MLPLPLLVLVAKVTIVLAVAFLVTTSMRRATAGVRHLVWFATLAALLVVPAVAAWAPLRVAVLPAAVASLAGALPASAADEALPATPTLLLEEETSAAAAPAASGPAANAPASRPAPTEPTAGELAPAAVRIAGRSLLEAIPTLVAIWAVVSLAIVLALVGAWRTARGIVRRGETLDAPDWMEPLWESADRLGLADAPRVVRSAEVKMPFACGLARPTIVLPAECDGWSLDRRRAVLLHELAHVRRRDLVGHTVARIACAVWWFHPLAWSAAKRLRAESEHACDDLALVSGARPADYAEHLLDIVASVRQDRTPLAAMAMARRAEFEGRMLAILDPERPRRASARWQGLAAVGLFAAASLLIGAVSPVAASAAAEPAVVAQEAPRSGATPPVRSPLPEAPDARTLPPNAPPDAPSTQVAAAIGSAQTQATRDAIATAVATAVATATADAIAEAEAEVEASAESEATAGRDRRIADERRRERALEQVLGVGAGRSEERALTARQQDERVTLLAKVLRTDSSASLRRIAAWGLAEHADEPEAVAALAAALRGDASVEVRETAAWALAEARRSAEVREALAAGLRDREVAVRRSAAWALGNVEDREAIPALVAALSDESREVRLRAIWAIGATEPRSAPAQLVALLRDEDEKVRELTAWALYAIEDPATAPALQAALQAEREKRLQVAYIRALGALGEKSVDAIRGLLESSDPEIKAMAVRVLAGDEASGHWPMPWPQPRPRP